MLSFVFPGQGSQYIGMGKDFIKNFSVSREVYNEVDDKLSFSLSKIIMSGEIEDLTLTENAQPAIMATSIAILRALRAEGLVIENSSFVAGHSLGEYTALCASESISLSDTAYILKMRGLFMQEAVPVGVGAMAAILGLSINDIKSLIDDVKVEGVCEIANDNEPNQIVISGNKLAIVKVCENAKLLGAKRAILLPVSAPFHSSMMTPAQDRMTNLLSEIIIKKPKIPLISNITANAIQDPKQIRENLVKQITGRVRWRESILFMVNQGVSEVFEIGPGKVLCNLIRRITSQIDHNNISKVDDLVKLRG